MRWSDPLSVRSVEVGVETLWGGEKDLVGSVLNVSLDTEEVTGK